MYRKNYVIKAILFIIIGLLAFFLLGSDFKAFILWWACLLSLGLIFLPLSTKVFANFNDNGYLFSKVIGIALSSYFMWLLSSLKVLKFRPLPAIVIIVFFGGLNYLILIKGDIKGLIKEKLDICISNELLFLLILLFAVFMRGFKPEAHGTEKFMDYGFMASMMRADYMPPQDFWFAGEKLNYYYVGQYIATFLTKVSFVPVTHSYNLMLMTIATLSFVLTYSLVYNISKNYYLSRKTEVKYSPHFAGFLSASGVAAAGNMHFTIFYYFVPALQDMLGIERTSYWFSNSTRYIGYHPDTADKTIHEFPSYSFILGDLHAHVLNIIFVLTIIAILYAWVLNFRKLDRLAIANLQDKGLWDLIKNAIQPRILLVGFFIGLFRMTNFWDFPIYFVVAGGTVLFSLIRNYGFTRITFLLTSIKGMTVIIIAELTALLFTLSFDQISTNIVKTSSRTPFYQLMILWGLPITLIIAFITELVQTYGVIKKVREKNSLKTKDYKGLNVIVSFFRSFSLSDLFILILGLCAIGLVLIPELVYVEDIYSGDYKRANTMFKLTYQAFIMFGICSGYIFVKFITVKRYLWQKKFTIITFALFLSTLMYFPVAIEDWYGDIRQVDNFKGLDASTFLKETMPADYTAISWINENIKDQAVILEANGDSYSDYQRVSVFTGHATVLGWYVHEWLWRGDTTLVNERSTHIEAIYTSDNTEEVIDLIDKYSIDYIYVGGLEQEKYPNLNHGLIKSLGEIVYDNQDYSNPMNNTYIVKIDY